MTIIGRGRVGTGLARALKGGNATVRLRAGRDPSLPTFRARRDGAPALETVVLAVPDGEIERVGRRLVGILPAGSAVLHCAGSRGTEALAPCRAAGFAVGVLHPAYSFPPVGTDPDLAGATFLIQGDPKARRAARQIARAVGARSIVGDLHGAAYHGALALVANGSAALAEVAVSTLARLGLSAETAEAMVAALLHSVARNVAEVGMPAALTGPIVRGDAQTVADHQRALARLWPKAAEAYRRIGPVILDSARSAGLTTARARAVRRALGTPAAGWSAKGSVPRDSRRP